MSKRLRLVTALLMACLCCPLWALEPGQVAPPIIDPSGDMPQDILLGYRGKVLYIDFWASWCGPCRKSLPALNELYREFGEQGFEVVAVNLDESAADMQRFLEKYPVDYRIVADPAGVNAKTYQIPGLPTAFLVDRSGEIHRIHIGFRKNDKARIQAELEQLLKEPKP